MEQKYNMRSPAVKRLMREAQELHQPTEEYSAQPLEDNLFEWHFTVRGPPETDFDGGTYHGRIILPAEYPMKPPSIILLTPNGRFEINKKICLSISGHHPESWQPCWSIRTALLAIIGFMPTSGKGAIGALDYTPNERKLLARKSQDWKCAVCGTVRDLLLIRTENYSAANQEAKELATQISFKSEENLNSEPSAKAKNNDQGETSTVSPKPETNPPASVSNHSSANVVSTSLPNLPLNVGLPPDLPKNEHVEHSISNPHIAYKEEDLNNQNGVGNAEGVRHRLNASAYEIPKKATEQLNMVSSELPQRSGIFTNAVMSLIVFIIAGLLFRRLFWM